MLATIRGKLLAFGLCGTAMVFLVGGVQWHNAESLQETMAALMRSARSIKNHLEADMMHDALRADVLAALQAGTAEKRATVQKDVAEHAQQFQEAVAANAKLTLPPAVAESLRALTAPQHDYIEAARSLVQHALADATAARQEFPAFATQFERMETAMGKVGDGLEAEAETLAKSAEAASEWTNTVAVLLVVVAGGLMFGSSHLLGRSILRPLGRLGDRVEELGRDGADLERRLDDGAKDELGRLARGVNALLAKLQVFVRSLRGNADGVLAAARQLHGTADELSAGAQRTQGEAAQVAAAAEEMSKSLQDMSSTSGSTADRIARVTTAVEQVHASADAVASGASDARRVVGEATRAAGASNTLVGQLGQAAAEIGRVIGTIQDIADQTNLLALNATIEAARAGEAGRGFAVVAGEVKALAMQTSTATLDIRQRIERIQADTRQTVDGIAAIVRTIDQVAKASDRIGGLVDEQRSSMAAISGDVVAASRMVAQSSEGIRQSATVSTEIARSIAHVDTAARGAANGAEAMRQQGSTLTQLASELGRLLAQFRI